MGMDPITNHPSSLRRVSFFIFLDKSQDGVFDSVGVCDIVELEAFLFASGLDMDIAEIEERLKESFRLRGHVLNGAQMQLGGDTVEQALLHDVDYSFIG